MIGRIVRSLSVGMLSLIFCGSLPKPSLAQMEILPDSTMPGENSTIDLQGNTTFIEGGATRDINLFHSFEEFNVGENQAAFFVIDNVNIENIFSRVSGDDPSDILGLLGTCVGNPCSDTSNTDAHLYFINPNGIFFGPNASLNIGGSFFATTAEAARFGENSLFGTANPKPPSALLNIDPSALLYTQSQIADINVETQRVNVLPNQNFILLGGNVNLLGSQIVANASSVIDVGAIAESGEVAIEIRQDSPVLDFENIDIQKGDISLDVGSFIGTLGNGSINLYQNDILVDNASFIGSLLVNIPSLISDGSEGGNINIQADGEVSLDNGSAIITGILGAQGESESVIGEIDINAESISLDNASGIFSLTAGNGNAGTVRLQAIDSITLSERSIIGSPSVSFQEQAAAPFLREFRGQGSGGDVVLSATNIELLDGSSINSSSFSAKGNAGSIRIIAADTFRMQGGSALNTVTSGEGDAGDINIYAGNLISLGDEPSESNISIASSVNPVAEANEVRRGGRISLSTDEHGEIYLDNRATISSNVEAEADGEGGDIDVMTGVLSVFNGASFEASTSGRGDAGSVLIRAQESITFNGSNAFSRVNSDAVGDGGNIKITADTLSVANGAQLIADTEGTGNAGNVIINVENSFVLDGSNPDSGLTSAVFSDVEESAVGNGGNINITANALSVTNGAFFGAGTFGRGDAGNIIIYARDSVTFNGSSAFSRVVENARGEGGNIDIVANSLSVVDGASLNADTFGRGDAGNVVIRAQDSVVFDSSSAFSRVNEDAVGDGGNIKITADTLSAINGAQFIANTEGTGDAGNVIIHVRDSFVIDGSTPNPDSGVTSAIFSDVEESALGDGGNIDITASTLAISNGAQLITSSAGDGDAGDILLANSSNATISGSSDSTGLSSGLFTDTSSAGAGGNITITTPQLRLADGAVIDAQTGGSGRGGDVTLDVGRAEILQGGQVVATSRGSGAAGSIILNATESVEVSGIDQSFSERVQIVPVLQQLFSPNSNLSIRSESSGSAGVLTINSPRMLISQGVLSAESATVDGGNIVLNLADSLVLRQNSQISATAGTAAAGGNGGNIEITTPVVVAIPREDSDITANAFEGTGGQVDIRSRAIFGIEEQQRLTPLSDITASSEEGVGGLIALESPDADLIESSLIELSQSLVESDQILVNSCISQNATSGGTLSLSNNQPLQPQAHSSSNTYYSTGTVQSSSENTANPTTISEPQAVYTLPNGRLLMSRLCKEDENSNQ